MANMCADPEYEMNFMRRSENNRQLYAYSAQQASKDKPCVLREISFISIDATTGGDPMADETNETVPKSPTSTSAITKLPTLAVTVENDGEISTVIEEDELHYHSSRSIVDGDHRQAQSLRGSRKMKRNLDQRRRTLGQISRTNSSGGCVGGGGAAGQTTDSSPTSKTISFTIPKLKLNSKEMPPQITNSSTTTTTTIAPTQPPTTTTTNTKKSLNWF